MIIGMEDELECSGMCRPSLFYFGRNITESGYPKETCLHQLRKYMMENGVPYTTCCTLLALTGLWLTLISFCLMRKEEKPGQKHEEEPDHEPAEYDPHAFVDMDKEDPGPAPAPPFAA